MDRRGAVELSIGTVVIIILALAMLILGLVFVNKAMCGVIRGIDVLNEKTASEILNLFGESNNLVIKEKSNDIAKGVDYGVGFAVRNNNADFNDFSYNVQVSDIGSCKFSESDALGFIVIGKTGDFEIPDGKEYIGLIRFSIPSNFDKCNLRYAINVKSKDQSYAFEEFDVNIIKKSFSQSLCS